MPRGIYEYDLKVLLPLWRQDQEQRRDARNPTAIERYEDRIYNWTYKNAIVVRDKRPAWCTMVCASMAYVQAALLPGGAPQQVIHHGLHRDRRCLPRATTRL
jgi:hypothetical protein